MATPEKIKNKIISLIDVANFTTGKYDNNLTDGVYSLVKGYGSGSESCVVANGQSLTIKSAAVIEESDNVIIIGG